MPAMYAFHRYLSGGYKTEGGGISPEHQTGSRTTYTPDGKRQEIKTYYLGDVKDDPKMQDEIENIFGVKE